MELDLQTITEVAGQVTALIMAILWIIDLRRQRDKLSDTILDEYKRGRDSRSPPQTNS